MTWKDKAKAAAHGVLKPSGNGKPQPARDETSKNPGKNKVSGFVGHGLLEPYHPFPIDTLPAPLREYVRQAAAALRCDAAYIALPALAAIASLIGNTRVIRLKPGWTEPSIIWSVIIGESGTLKTPAYLLAVAYIFTLQKRLRQDYKAKLAKYAEDMEAYKANKDDGAEKPEPPVLERVIVSDITIEKLAEVLEQNPRGLLVGREELAAWIGSFTRYKGKSISSDLPHWLEAFRAGAWIVDRKIPQPKTHYFVEKANVSITGTIQSGTLARALTADFVEAGLPARLLMAMPPRTAKKWTETVVDPETEQAYHQLLDQLQRLPFSRDKDGNEVPYALNLSLDAKSEWVRHYNAFAKVQADADGELAAALSKLEAYSARLALLHHVVSCLASGDDDRQPVGVESVQTGVILCHWFADEAKRIYVMLSESEDQRDTRRLVEFIQSRGGKITVKELQRSNQRKYPTTGLAEDALVSLAKSGAGHWQERPPTGKGGRPTADFILCVTSVTKDETLANPEKSEVSSYVTPEDKDEWDGHGDAWEPPEDRVCDVEFP